jgi:hypothetical protein
MIAYWIREAASDPGLLATTLLVASRDLFTRTPSQNYNKLALYYKGESIRLLIDEIGSDGGAVSNVTIAKALFLASDAVSAETPQQQSNKLTLTYETFHPIRP